MNDPVIIAANRVTEADLIAARLGQRFGRLDLASRLALLAVEAFLPHFDQQPRERTAICLSAVGGSLSTDIEFWQGRDSAGGPSPTLFAYTLPSAAIGEIAIRHRLNGPNLCLIGDGRDLLAEARNLLCRGEADACVCVACHAVTPAASDWLGVPAGGRATALLLARSGPGPALPRENERDIESWCDSYCARQAAE